VIVLFFRVQALTSGCFLQITIIGDVVPVKNGSGFVPGYFHGHVFGDSGPNHIADSRAAKVMKQPSGKPGFF
jgi:hypothetical protein